MKAVDLFCGAGGSSTGAVAAGVEVVAAVNHWQLAIDTHCLNHPGTKHYCQDAALLDPHDLPAHDLLLASPECRGHAKARGVERVHHDASRATAWCVINIAEITRPKWIVVENVPELRLWQLYPEWTSSLKSLGYTLTENILDAADFGVPQNRVRLFVVATLHRRALHLESQAEKHIPIRGVLDLAGGKWSPVRGHADATLARVKRGRREFGSEFLMPYYGSGSGETGRSLDRPIGTITTRDRWAIVRGSKMRMLTPEECKQAMGFPKEYELAGCRSERIWQLGNAVAPGVMRAICTAIGQAA